MDEHGPRKPIAEPPKSEDTTAETTADLSPALSSLLEDAPFPALESAAMPQPGATLVGVCIDETHPSLVGRVRIQWQHDGRTLQAWLPTLHRLPVRCGDRVLLTMPSNAIEPVVLGVLDGFAQRPSPSLEAAASLPLRDDEVLRVEDTHGRPLLEVRPTQAGPVVRLLQRDVNVEVDGALELSADSIRMRAHRGKVEIEASDDVDVKGEVIHLN